MASTDPASLKILELELVYLCNKMIGYLTSHNGNNDCVYLNQNIDGSYKIVDITLNELRKSLDAECFRFWMYKPSTLAKWIKHSEHKPGDCFVGPIDEHGRIKLDQLVQIESNVIDIWFNSAFKREYNSKVFNPRPYDHPDVSKPIELNYFPGMGITREECENYTDWSILSSIMHHLRYCFCGTEEEFKHFLGLEAVSLQEPWYRHSVATCIGGEEGIGKTAFCVNVLGPIYGDNFLLAHDQEDVIGKYTSLIENKLLVILDEVAMLSRDKANKLKNEISAEVGRMRKMFQETAMTSNYRRYFLLSNDLATGFVPVGTGGRRFYTLFATLKSYLDYLEYRLNIDKLPDQPSKRVSAADYNKQLWNANDPRDVVKTFANFLYNLNVDKFDPRKFPITDLFVEQKLISMLPLDRFIISFLTNGKITATSASGELLSLVNLDENNFADNKVEHLHNHYLEFLNRIDPKGKKAHSCSEIEFAQKFKDRFGSEIKLITEKSQPRRVRRGGKDIYDVDEYLVFRMPSLPRCREVFASYVPGVERIWKTSEQTQIKEFVNPDNNKKMEIEIDPKIRLPHRIDWIVPIGDGPAVKTVVYDETKISNPYPEDFHVDKLSLRDLMSPQKSRNERGEIVITYPFDLTIPHPYVQDRDATLGIGSDQTDYVMLMMKSLFEGWHLANMEAADKKKQPPQKKPKIDMMEVD